MLTGCEKSIFFSSGTETSATVQLNPFLNISVDGKFEIELRNDSVYSIEITGNKSIIKNIEYNSHDQKLSLTDKNSLQWLPDYPKPKIVISFPDISEISINSPVRIFSKDTLRVSTINLLANGSLAEIDLIIKASGLSLTTLTDDFGNYTLSGYSEKAEFRVYGSARLNAAGLLTENANVRNYSIGDCHVNVSHSLNVWLEHYGDVYYHGSPGKVTINKMESSGRLIKANPGK